MNLLFIGLSLAAILVMIWWARSMNQRQAMKKRMADAKARAHKRRTDRHYFDPEPYHASMDIGLAIQVTEIDDKFDGRGDLTNIQTETISRIMAGHSPKIIHKGLFDESNIVERIVLD